MSTPETALLTEAKLFTVIAGKEAFPISRQISNDLLLDPPAQALIGKINQCGQIPAGFPEPLVIVLRIHKFPGSIQLEGDMTNHRNI